MYVVLFGSPGAGKGTQAARLGDATALVHVSTGDMFRDNIRTRTELGSRAEAYITKGDLVPDALAIALLMDRLDQADAAAGAILDGFPRTTAQAQALDAALRDRGEQVDVALLIEVSEAEIIRRLGGRWSCPGCGAVFQAQSIPPEREGVCDRCGKQLVHRPDDAPDAIRNRLQVYHEQTEPLVAYYAQTGALVRVDGERSPEAVQTDLLRALDPISA